MKVARDYACCNHDEFSSPWPSALSLVTAPIYCTFVYFWQTYIALKHYFWKMQKMFYFQPPVNLLVNLMRVFLFQLIQMMTRGMQLRLMFVYEDFPL